MGFRQGAGIKRPELKKQAIEYVMKKYGLKLCEDICEAICLGDAFVKSENIESED